MNKDIAQVPLFCHPESRLIGAKDLADEWVFRQIREPDSSLRFAPFRMTDEDEDEGVDRYESI